MSRTRVLRLYRSTDPEPFSSRNKQGTHYRQRNANTEHRRLRLRLSRKYVQAAFLNSALLKALLRYRRFLLCCFSRRSLYSWKLLSAQADSDCWKKLSRCSGLAFSTPFRWAKMSVGSWGGLSANKKKLFFRQPITGVPPSPNRTALPKLLPTL